MTTAAARIHRKATAASTNMIDCSGGHLSNDVTVVGSAPSCGLVASGKIRESSRDDSGNSSSSSSLEQLEQPCRGNLAVATGDMKATEGAAADAADTSSLAASTALSTDYDAKTWTDENLCGQYRHWQSVDYITERAKDNLFVAGYEDEEVELHLPLHKTVCCALCR